MQELTTESGKRKMHIAFLGENGFPHGFGAIQRMLLMARSLNYAGAQVEVICRKGVWKKGSIPQMAPQGIYQEVPYTYISDDVFRPTGFLNRNIQKIKGLFREYSYLKSLRKENKLDAAIVSSMSGFHLLRYWFYARMIGYPIILNYVEFASVMKQRSSIGKRINDKLIDYGIVKLFDAALPISQTLKLHYEKMAPGKPNLKLPILCDFGQFNSAPSIPKKTTYLYCGAASYIELVDFVVHAYDRLMSQDNNSELVMVLGGSEEEIMEVQQRIDDSVSKMNIRLFTNVPHTEIPGYFASASALLIPLRPTLQDASRFPHKIGEYLASGKPLITSAYGEITQYDFIDTETALVAAEYDKEKFTEKMKFVYEYPQKASEIGVAGRRFGHENFDYKSQSKRFFDFLMSLIQK